MACLWGGHGDGARHTQTFVIDAYVGITAGGVEGLRELGAVVLVSAIPGLGARVACGRVNSGWSEGPRYRSTDADRYVDRAKQIVQCVDRGR